MQDCFPCVPLGRFEELCLCCSWCVFWAQRVTSSVVLWGCGHRSLHTWETHKAFALFLLTYLPRGTSGEEAVGVTQKLGPGRKGRALPKSLEVQKAVTSSPCPTLAAMTVPFLTGPHLPPAYLTMQLQKHSPPLTSAFLVVLRGGEVEAGQRGLRQCQGLPSMAVHQLSCCNGRWALGLQ